VFVALRADADKKYALPSKDTLADGSALIVVCADSRLRRAYPSSDRGNILVAEPIHTYWATIGAAVENLHLAAAALGLGLRLWIAGLLIWAIGHAAAVWAAKRDPLFVETARRHLRIPTHLNV